MQHDAPLPRVHGARHLRSAEYTRSMHKSGEIRAQAHTSWQLSENQHVRLRQPPAPSLCQAHRLHAMRDAAVKHRQLPKPRRDERRQLRQLGAHPAVKAAPVVQHVRLQQHGFAAAEAPPLPVGQGQDKGKGAVRRIRVQPLVAAAHVAAAGRAGGSVNRLLRHRAAAAAHVEATQGAAA